MKQICKDWEEEEELGEAGEDDEEGNWRKVVAI